MKIFFAFLLSLIGTLALAQDSWKICLDKKTLLKTSTEDEKKNFVEISSTDLKKAKALIINYNEPSQQKGWERTISVYNVDDQELKIQTGKKLSLKVAELKNLLNQYKEIKIYTLNSPTDPKMKMQVRLRRIHLCTLVLK
jgi:hypothetical protein